MASRKGKPNKATAQRERVIASEGITPLAYLISVMRDESLERPERVDAAKAAAPYVHPRLSSVNAHVTGQIDILQWLTEAE